MSDKDKMAVMLLRVDVEAHAASVEYTNRLAIHEACKRALRPAPPTDKMLHELRGPYSPLSVREAATRFIRDVLANGWDPQQ